MKYHSIPVLCVTILLTMRALSQDCSPQHRLITVTGTAEINVPPDEVILNLGVESRDRDLSAAKSRHDARMKKIMADARNAGVDPRNIQTNALRMNADYSEEKVPRFLGYEITQTVQITLKDLTKYESLTSKLLQDGVNRIDSVEFEVAETRKYMDDARLKAIRAAREKAIAMATELGQTIGRPWTILENNASANYYQANAYASFGSRAVQVSEESGGSSVAPGEVSIRASVNVSFELQ